MAHHDEEWSVKLRLWDHILQNTHGTTDLSLIKRHRDPEGYAFFLAISRAFTSCDKMHGRVPVDRELVQYLAGWAGNVASGGDEVGGLSNHFIRRGLDGFVSTLQGAVQHNQLRRHGDKILYGCFEVPKWFIDHHMIRVHQKAEHDNDLWDEDDHWKEFIRTDTRPD